MEYFLFVTSSFILDTLNKIGIKLHNMEAMYFKDDTQATRNELVYVYDTIMT